jgi:hypothetical protein
MKLAIAGMVINFIIFVGSLIYMRWSSLSPVPLQDEDAHTKYELRRERVCIAFIFSGLLLTVSVLLFAKALHKM